MTAMEYSQAWRARTLALIAGLVLAPVTTLAAGDECRGVWHFEINPPSAEQEAWLSPRSLCRSQYLPKTLDLEYRQGAALPTVLSKSTYRPTDVLLGGGSCEFRLQSDDQPMRFGLAFEVPAKGAQVKGKVACSESEAGPNGTRSGMHLDLEVSATHTGAEPSNATDLGAEIPERELQAVLKACRDAKAEPLWELMTQRFRAAVDARAAELTKVLSANDLRQTYHYVGKPRAFTGTALLRHAVKLGDSADNPCAGIARWKILERGPVKDAYVVAIERAAGRTFALRFLREGRRWLLDQITQDVPNR